MQIQHGMQVLKKQLVDLDGPGRVRAITKVVSDFYVPAKITHACAHLLSGICTRARYARTLEGAASMMGDEFAIAELFEEVAAAEQGVGKQALAEFMEAEKGVGKEAVRAARAVLKFDVKTYPHQLNKFSENANDIHHMFRKDPRKILDTPINRKKVLNMTQNEHKCFGIDKRGVVSYAQVEITGEQLWAEVDPLRHYIRNCGINKAGEHRSWNSETGFKLQYFQRKR